VEDIEEHEGHIPTPALALSKYRLDDLVTIASTRLTIEDS
jgi:hypothetical protein